MSEKIRQILVIIGTLGMISVNYLAVSGFVNNKTTGELSDQYLTQITPSGYAFSIWSLIYLGLIAFSIFQALPSQTENKILKEIRVVYFFNCVANALWIYAWHYEFVPASLLIMVVLLATLIFINLKLIDAKTSSEIIIVKVPFSIYFGWITVATILNASITLVFLGVKFTENTTSIIGAVLILIAAVLGCFFRFKISSAFYPLTIAWGVTAIAVKQSGHTITVVTCAVAVIALLIASLSGFIKQDEQR